VTNGTIYQTEIENKMVLGADFGSIKASFERGVKDIYGRTLTDSSRVAGQKTMTIRPGYKGWMNVIPWAESYGQTVDFTVPGGGPIVKDIQVTSSFTVSAGGEAAPPKSLTADVALMTATEKARECDNF
ncbi:hypothetical protein, partial [Streptomyces osmaniensis]|uniref:hypothetical protein n=1 Tax=Streptomyces osmaniensis TaxID=593134 RepID=UPI0031FCEDC4